MLLSALGNFKNFTPNILKIGKLENLSYCVNDECSQGRANISAERVGKAQRLNSFHANVQVEKHFQHL